MRSRRTWALVVVPLLLVVACSDGERELTEEEQRYATAFARDLADGQGGPTISPEEAECVGEEVLRVLGVDPFHDAGVEPADFDGGETPGQLLGDGRVSQDDAEEIADRWLDCVDLASSFLEQARGLVEMDDDEEACFQDRLEEDDALRGYLEVTFTSDDPADVRTVTNGIALMLQSCTTPTTSASDDEVIDRMATGFVGKGLADEERSRCLAEGIIDRVGVEALGRMVEDGGLSGPALEAQEQVSDAMREAAAECGLELPESAFDVGATTTTAGQ